MSATLEEQLRKAFASVFPDNSWPEDPALALDCMVAEIIHCRHVAKGLDVRLRPFIQVQRAHDLLVAMLVDPILSTKLGDDEKRWLMPRADVLCWTLVHEHNDRFALELARIEQLLRNAGVELKDSGKLHYPHNGKPN